MNGRRLLTELEMLLELFCLIIVKHSISLTTIFWQEKSFNSVFHYLLKSAFLNRLQSVFLNRLLNRLQRVRLANDCFSEWGSVPSGVPQGTKLDPWLFILMINDLRAPEIDYWK